MRRKPSKSSKARASKAKNSRSKSSKFKNIKKRPSKRTVSKLTRKKEKPSFKKPRIEQSELSLQKEKEIIEAAKLTATEAVSSGAIRPQEDSFALPVRYADNRIMLLARDPWWLHTYWDISESRINEVISSIPVYERQNLKWVVRAYDVSGVRDFNGNNANQFFDIDINFEACNWYININQPEREWCVEIGLMNPMGKFFPIARSNFVKTPYFGISSEVDEEWVLPDDDYFKILGLYDLGKSSLERRQRLEEIIKQQISSPLASWGISSLYPQEIEKKEKFFLEVWTELIVYGRTEPGAEVKIEGKKVSVRRDGTFSSRYSLPIGDFKFEVTATSKNKKHKRKETPAVKRYKKK